MGSGYFPFYKLNPQTEKLKEAVRLIEEVRSSVSESIYCGDDGQFDNAASDGGYLRQLSLAETLIEECYEKD